MLQNAFPLYIKVCFHCLSELNADQQKDERLGGDGGDTGGSSAVGGPKLSRHHLSTNYRRASVF